MGGNIIGVWTNCRNSSWYIKYFILSKCWEYPIQDNQCPERGGHHRPSFYPPVNTNKTKLHTPSTRLSKVNHISIYSLCNYLHQSRGHRDVLVTVPRPVIKGIDKCTGTMRVKGLPPSTSDQGHSIINLYITVYTVDEICEIMLLHYVILSLPCSILSQQLTEGI